MCSNSVVELSKLCKFNQIVNSKMPKVCPEVAIVLKLICLLPFGNYNVNVFILLISISLPCNLVMRNKDIYRWKKKKKGETRETLEMDRKRSLATDYQRPFMYKAVTMHLKEHLTCTTIPGIVVHVSCPFKCIVLNMYGIFRWTLSNQ